MTNLESERVILTGVIFILHPTCKHAHRDNNENVSPPVNKKNIRKQLFIKSSLLSFLSYPAALASVISHHALVHLLPNIWHICHYVSELAGYTRTYMKSSATVSFQTFTQLYLIEFMNWWYCHFNINKASEYSFNRYNNFTIWYWFETFLPQPFFPT